MIYQISHTRGKQRGARGGFELLNSPTGHPHRLLSCQPVSLHPTQATKVSFSGWFINCQTWIQNSHPALKEMQNRSFTRICCSSSAISGKSSLKNIYLLMEELFKFNGRKLQAQSSACGTWAILSSKPLTSNFLDKFSQEVSHGFERIYSLYHLKSYPSPRAKFTI